MNRAKTYGAAAAAIVLAGLMVAAWVQAPAAGEGRPSAAARATQATTNQQQAASGQQQGDPMMAARTKGSDGARILVLVSGVGAAGVGIYDLNNLKETAGAGVVGSGLILTIVAAVSVAIGTFMRTTVRLE